MEFVNKLRRSFLSGFDRFCLCLDHL